jgi:hypothetical protein
MKNLIQAAVVTLFAASAAQAQQAVQWKVSDGGNGHWYQLQLSQFGRDEASATARTHGAELASITDGYENEFVRGVAAGQPAWIGGNQAAGACEPGCGWMWLDAEPWSYTRWDLGTSEPNDGGGGKPGEQGVELRASGYWNDYWTWRPLPAAVIEWSADCNSDGIVDYGQCHDGTLPDYDGNNVPDCCERGEECAVGSYPVQWRIEDGGNGHWYDQRIWTGPKSIVGISASYVAQIGAHAVTITSPSENEFVYRAVHSRTSGATHGGYSILGGYQDPGASDYSEPAGGWRWVTGEPMTYLNWGPALPDNCCGGESVLQYPNASYWNDAETAGVPAGHRYRVIVEWDADCNQDGIVDKGQILQGELADQNVDGIPDTCQCGTIPSLPGCCPGDLDHDRAVGGADIGLLLSNWGPCGSACPYDLNNDTKVNGGDLGLLLAGWGPCQ